MVSQEPARADASASRSAGPQTQRPFWVLRHYRQLRRTGAVSVGGDRNMARVAGAPRRSAGDVVGADAPRAGVFLLAATPGRPFHLCSEAVTIHRGTGCGKSARTGLWGCRWATAGTTRNHVCRAAAEYLADQNCDLEFGVSLVFGAWDLELLSHQQQ